ncbi:MAG TPA: hypothetical protein VHS31_08695 [Tepidisphaeraceae bacterium]|jgi:hypothetical protein|nr:hypothetical protein [Tepidisphaeraceae bacterium]
MNIKTLTGLLILFFLVTAAGCAAPPPYFPGVRYAPEPALVVVPQPGKQVPTLSVMASVIGIRRGDPHANVPPAVEIRLRFENNGPVAVSFEPRTLDLVTGSLQEFEPVETRPAPPFQLSTGQSQTVSAFFPFPPGFHPRMPSLDALRLRWTVTIDNQPVSQTVSFYRATPMYYASP